MKVGILIAVLLLIASAVLFACLLEPKVWVSEIRMSVPIETADELDNPRRGGYHIYRFTLQDEPDFESTYDFSQFIKDDETNLALVEINLYNYRSSEISQQGMDCLRELFGKLTDGRKDLIVRFLYDFSGAAFANEPKNIEIILTHIRQVSAVINEYKERIYTLQGVFIGNWGEMNGSRYSSDREIEQLILALAEQTDPSVMLAVRTPAVYRMLCGENGKKNPVLNGRLGLYNDGMLGNEHDLGTYSAVRSSHSYDEAWIRSEELEFQDRLCRTVYNGGEVLSGSSYSFLPSAAADFRKMHVSYLNLDYDRSVWEWWETTAVEEDGVFKGTNGSDYILKHLGYRPVIESADLSVNRREKSAAAAVTVRNDGFAPVYRPVDAYLVLYDGETEFRYRMTGDMSAVSSGEKTVFQTAIRLDELEPKPYSVRLHLCFEDGTELETANAWNEDHEIGEILP